MSLFTLCQKSIFCQKKKTNLDRWERKNLVHLWVKIWIELTKMYPNTENISKIQNCTMFQIFFLVKNWTFIIVCDKQDYLMTDPQFLSHTEHLADTGRFPSIHWCCMKLTPFSDAIHLSSTLSKVIHLQPLTMLETQDLCAFNLQIPQL